MSNNLMDHARVELAAAGFEVEPGKPIFDKMVVEDVLQLIDIFSHQGHSGGSAPLIVRLFAKLAMYEPLTPLTGLPEEWVELGPTLWQNKRCSHVFKDAGGAYDIDGVIWLHPDGSRTTNVDSRVRVVFPYTPRSVERRCPT